MIPTADEAKLYGRISQLEAINVELVEALKRAESALYAAAQYDGDPAWDVAKETSAVLARAKEEL